MRFAPFRFPTPGGDLPLTWMAGLLVDAAAAPGDWPLEMVPVPATLGRAVPGRRATYAAGRIAMRLALETAGYPAPAPWLDRLPSGAPAFPGGWTGSLAHTDALCVAAVAPTGVMQAVGIDCEAEMSDEVAARVVGAVAPELAAMDVGVSRAMAVTLTFAAKESLFKALHPHVGRFFGMDAARCVAIDVATRQVTLTLTEPLASWPSGAAFTVHWTNVAAHTVTVVAIPAHAGRAG